MAETATLLSLNEIRFYFTRAAVGAGAPFGIGEEFARASSWLAFLGIDPAVAALPALDGLASGGSDGALVILHRDGILRVGCRERLKVSALFAGPSVADRLTIESTRERAYRLHLDEVDQPLLILAAAAAVGVGRTRLYWRLPDERPVLAEVGDGRVRLDWPLGADLGQCDPAALEIVLNGPSDGPPRDALVIHVAEGRKRAVTCGVAVDGRAWSGVLGHFRKCLVPSTERSRSEGAGAGPIDNV